MIADIIISILGAVLVLIGADKLTDGSVALARRFQIPELVIGLTIVAMGTSLPEFVVSLLASIDGSPGMGIGNVVGSNLFNTLMIVGVTAAVSPIAVQPSTVSKDIPFSLLASIVLAALALDTMLDVRAGSDLLSRGDGIALLGFFAVFMAYTFAIAHSGNADSGTTDATSSQTAIPMWKAALLILVGLAGLIFGGQLFVDGASSIARQLGISDAVIGLTLVAGGTSLPELATSIIAARKGQSGLAIGNVIGSNLFNIFWILGLCSTVTPMPVAGITWVDMAMLIGSNFAFWLFAKTHLRIVRTEGLALIAAYVGYIAWLIANV